MGFFCMFSIEMEVLIMCITLMGTSYGNSVGAGSIFWTAEYQNNVLCTMYNIVYEYVFFLLIYNCALYKSPGNILECIYFFIP